MREVFKEIIEEEFLSSETIPNYEEIIHTLAVAERRMDGSHDWSNGLFSIVTLCAK